MELLKINGDFSVCKLAGIQAVDLTKKLYFLAKTDEELSLVCLTQDVPAQTTHREDGWKAFRIQGVLDFSLIGILATLTTLLANHGVGLFAISTYNTDYILTKAAQYETALELLANAGYTILSQPD